MNNGRAMLMIVWLVSLDGRSMRWGLDPQHQEDSEVEAGLAVVASEEVVEAGDEAEDKDHSCKR